ncbi:hypothetical protein [Flavobacterium sp.]|uniref:hypothetical protein n=1 Tax=Flavobacterium sp. TaxID=239 RepID=UPI003753B268
MIIENRIRKHPLFDLFLENNCLIINNTDYLKDNGAINTSEILGLEIIKDTSFINKFIEVVFGFNIPAKSSELRINMRNGFKDIILTDCDIEQVEKTIYEINKLIMNKENEL